MNGMPNFVNTFLLVSNNLFLGSALTPAIKNNGFEKRLGVACLPALASKTNYSRPACFINLFIKKLFLIVS
jgi:hypothetical protein